MRAGHGHLRRGRLIVLVAVVACGRHEAFTPPAPPPPWSCAGATCTQRVPELPDDGEWECADVDGVAMCRGGGDAAGVVAGPAAPGWACGARRGAPGERICVDETPDVPDGGGWKCHYLHSPERRVCVKGESHRQHRRERQPGEPDCWLDGDCGGGACLAGRCR